MTQANGKTPLRITDTTLRDGHQSLWATRLKIEDMVKIIETIDSVGYYSLEVWGGATFDVCLRFMRENPWERLRLIKSKATKTPLQMLLRGQNVVGYKNYADDLLDRFVALACYNGMDIFRVFDALNDTRNLESAIKSIKRHGGHAQGTLSYTLSPFHTVETFVKAAKEQVELGIDTLCIKDMAGILSPKAANDLVSALVREVDVPIQLHCHCSSGMAIPTYISGVNAGAGAIDCAISSLGGFSSLPPVETMVGVFRETEFEVDLDIEALRKIAKYFNELTPKMQPQTNSNAYIDPEILVHQIPGGMISNLRSQLSQQKALERLNEVLEEVPRVREDLGYPPLVTPTSQIVGIQSVFNVLSGERYKIIPNEVKSYVKGLYGRSPKELDPAFIKKILGDEKPITHRPADDLEPMLPKAIEHLDSSLVDHEEDIISYCLFPEMALEYFQWRSLPESERPPAPVDIEIAERLKIAEKIASPDSSSQEEFLSPGDYSGVAEMMQRMSELGISELVIKKNDVNIALRSDTVSVPFTPVQRKPEPAKSPEKKPEQKAPALTGAKEAISSPLVGKFYLSSQPGKPSFVKTGDMVKAGQKVCMIEAMKLVNEITAPRDCKIVEILAVDGAHVEKGQPLIAIE